MTDLHHSVPINTGADRLYAAFATQSGMQGWWTRDTVMDARIGGSAEFGFDRRGIVFRMTLMDLAPGRSVRMRCTGDHPEWADTVLEWSIESGADGSVLRFTHRGWRETTDFCASCNSMWGRLMFRLKDFVESGKPDPQWTE